MRKLLIGTLAALALVLGAPGAARPPPRTQHR